AGVRYRRLHVPQAIAHRPRNRSRAARADLEMATGIKPGDRAAAGPDRVDVEHWRLDGIALQVHLTGQPGTAALDQRHVGRGAAHIEGNDVVVAGEPGNVRGSNHAGAWTGENGAHRLALRHLERDHPSVTLGDVRRHADALRPQLRLQ